MFSNQLLIVDWCHAVCHQATPSSPCVVCMTCSKDVKLCAWWGNPACWRLVPPVYHFEGVGDHSEVQLGKNSSRKRMVPYLQCLVMFGSLFFWPRHYYAVSVGLEGEAGKEEGFTDCQYQELMNLISSLKTKYNIKGWNVLGLEEVCMPPGRYTSPGRYFDWSRISPVTFNVDSARGLPEGSAAPTLRQLMEDWGYGLGLPEDDATFQQRLQIFQHRYEVDAEDENASRAASQRKLSALIHARSLHNSGLWRCCAGIGLILVALLMARFRRLKVRSVGEAIANCFELQM